MEKRGGKWDKSEGSGKQSKFKGPNPSKTQSTHTDKGKRKATSNLEYDDTRFTDKIEEKFYNRVWVKNRVVIERKFDLNSFNKKLIVTPDTFAKIFDIPRVENPDFAFSNVRMPDLPTISREMLLAGDTWNGEVQCNNTRLKDRYLILFLFSCHFLLPFKCTIAISTTRWLDCISVV